MGKMKNPKEKENKLNYLTLFKIIIMNNNKINL